MIEPAGARLGEEHFPPQPLDLAGDSPPRHTPSGGGDPPLERQQPSEGWQTYTQQRWEGGGRPPAPPTQKRVPTRNHFAVLQEEASMSATDPGPSSRLAPFPVILDPSPLTRVPLAPSQPRASSLRELEPPLLPLSLLPIDDHSSP